MRAILFIQPLLKLPFGSWWVEVPELSEVSASEVATPCSAAFGFLWRRQGEDHGAQRLRQSGFTVEAGCRTSRRFTNQKGKGVRKFERPPPKKTHAGGLKHSVIKVFPEKIPQYPASGINAKPNLVTDLQRQLETRWVITALESAGETGR